jgi:hypothetical protein
MESIIELSPTEIITFIAVVASLIVKNTTQEDANRIADILVAIGDSVLAGIDSN